MHLNGLSHLFCYKHLMSNNLMQTSFKVMYRQPTKPYKKQWHTIPQILFSTLVKFKKNECGLSTSFGDFNIKSCRTINLSKYDKKQQNSEDSNELIQDMGPDLLEMDNRVKEVLKKRTYHDKSRNEIVLKKRKWQSDYNYGLSGPTKTSLKYKKPMKSKVEGEILFGIHPVLMALKQRKRMINKLYLKKDFLTKTREEICDVKSYAEEMNISTEYCPKFELDEMSLGRPHQGICLDVSEMILPTYEQHNEEISVRQDEEPELQLVLSSVQDPMNFGAILRSAYFLGVHRVLTTNCCRLSPVVSKASSGIMELIEIYHVNDLIAFILEQKKKRKFIIGSIGLSKGTEYHTERLHDVALKQDSILIIGNEGEGLSEKLIELCDQLVTISPVSSVQQENVPLDSLNVSVATGIMLYHLLFSRTHNSK